jgi:flagellar hook-basal body complex protein FliE
VALQTLARKSGSRMLARIAEQAKTGGYFDKVIASIDEMIALLRREEKQDIEHRDRCQGAENDNKISKEELTNTIDRAGKDIKRMEHEQKTTEQDVEDVAVEIQKTENDMEQALAMRNKEHKAFVKAVEDDVKAKAILEKAKLALVEFYKRNNIPMLIQKQGPKEYTVDPDKAPEVVWEASGGEYKGAREENEGIVAIITMIIEDVQKEIDDSRKDDAEDQAVYEKERAAMEETLKAQLASKAAMEKRLQELEQKIQDTSDLKDAKNEDLEAEQELTKAIGSDCSWVTTHFQDRADKRKVELDGLVSAKDYLAGVATGTQLSP